MHSNNTPWIYQLRVTLLYTDPPIWRQLLVPADMTLGEFHHVLQTAMGWEDDHLHEFTARRRRFRPPNPRDRDRFMGADTLEDENSVSLSGVFSGVKSKIGYTYDFGDNWEHVIVLEKRLPADSSLHDPQCTGGQLACPPEDCGGIPGFYDLMEALRDPNHERHEEMLEWIGEYDPEAFSVEEVNRNLGRGLGGR